jgi:tetratricopeptide (TPR) repeat protein
MMKCKRAMLALFAVFLGGPAQGQTDVEGLFEAAQQARAQGNFADAEARYLEVIRRSPQFAAAYHNLGIVYFSQRKYRDASRVLEKAVKLNPRLPQAHFMLGLAAYQLYEPERAARAFSAALGLNPGDKNALLYLGKTQLQMRDYRNAAGTFEKLAQSKPPDPDVLYNLSLSYMKLMLESVNRLGAAAPQSYQFRLLLAQDAESRNFREEAIEKYKEALALKGSAAPVGVHYALGILYARTGKYDEAAAEFREELKINANDSLSLWRLGELALLADPKQALVYLERAVALNPEFPQASLAYGRALSRQGDHAKAIEQFQNVVRLAPEEHTVHYHLFKAYRQLGRAAEARQELARFQEMARKKSEKMQETARQQLNVERIEQGMAPEPEPGFAPERDPVHQ